MRRGFEVKALYTVPELAAMIRMHQRTLRRWLVRRDVALLRVGASVGVTLVAFREAFPDLWTSTQAVSGVPCRARSAVRSSNRKPALTRRNTMRFAEGEGVHLET